MFEDNAGIVRFEECRRFRGRAAADVYGQDDNTFRSDGRLQPCQCRKLAHARGAPCGPEIEQNIAAAESGELVQPARGIGDGDRRDRRRARSRAQLRERRGRSDGVVDKTGACHI